MLVSEKGQAAVGQNKIHDPEQLRSAEVRNGQAEKHANSDYMSHHQISP